MGGDATAVTAAINRATIKWGTVSGLWHLLVAARKNGINKNLLIGRYRTQKLSSFAILKRLAGHIPRDHEDRYGLFYKKVWG